MPKQAYFVVLIFLFTSCVPNNEDDKSGSKPSFLTALLKNQEQILELSNASVTKCSDFNAEMDTSFIEKLNWTHELGLFYELDIFKPSFIDAYEETQSVEGSSTHLKYHKKAKTKNSIDSLFINKNSSDTIYLIEGFGSHKNFFFSSKSNYKLRFDSISGRLKMYSLQSEKTFIWGKSDAFSISASIEN